MFSPFFYDFDELLGKRDGINFQHVKHVESEPKGCSANKEFNSYDKKKLKNTYKKS